MSTWIVVGFLFFENGAVEQEYRNVYDDIHKAFTYYRWYSEEHLSEQPNLNLDSIKTNPKILYNQISCPDEYECPDRDTEKDFFVITANDDLMDLESYPTGLTFTEILCVIRQSKLQNYCISIDEPLIEEN